MNRLGSSAGATLLGRCVAVVGTAALVALTGGWLFLGAGPRRAAVVWVALAALAGAVLAVAGYVLRVGRVTPARGYALALDAVRDPAARPDPAVPARLHGSGWTWARITALAVALGTAPVLFFSLGAGAPDRGETAGRIVGAHYVIKELPVVAVARVERAGSSPRASSEADYTVRLPSAEGGTGVPATFRAEVSRGVAEVGDTFPVAYVPGHPQWGAVGATGRSYVQAQLDGRALGRGGYLAAAVWAVLAVLMVGSATAIASLPRRARRVQGDWVALRATATGVAEHVEPPSGAGSGEGGAKSTSRYPCLTLHTGTGEVPLRLAASHRRAAPVLVGSEGWLVWDPAASQGRAAAEFLADAGWQLPGRVPAAEAARVAALPRGPVPVDPGRRVRLLELGSLWPRTVPAAVLLGTTVSVAAAGALLLPAGGGWRIWVAVAGVLAPLLVWVSTLAEADPKPEAQVSGAPTG
ncbi:hypothetical protein [Streptomyces sp. NPDC101393]|uniref:hypothetical protein n=1 Tax=Streptomyces sp. NPDC101393 TaxID=3366141 RepID=UPI0037FABB74